MSVPKPPVPPRVRPVPFYKDPAAKVVLPALGVCALLWGCYVTTENGGRLQDAQEQMTALSVQLREAEDGARATQTKYDQMAEQLKTQRASFKQQLAKQRQAASEQLQRERTSFEQQLAEAKAAAPLPGMPSSTAVSDSLAASSSNEVDSGEDEADGFRRRCLDAIAQQLGVESVIQSRGGMISPKPWGPAENHLWFWKPNIRVPGTEYTGLYTCRISNDQGFEVFEGL